MEYQFQGGSQHLKWALQFGAGQQLDIFVWWTPVYLSSSLSDSYKDTVPSKNAQ